MLMSILYALIIVLIVFSVNMLFQRSHNYKLYILTFLCSCLMFECSHSKCHAMTLPNQMPAFCREHKIGYVPDHALTKDQVKYYEQERDMHKYNAERTFNDAKSSCWYYPNTSDRHKARECFQVAVATLAASGTKEKAIIILASSLVTYGFDCWNEWDYIENKLYWSRYHWEMYDFYVDLLSKASML